MKKLFILIIAILTLAFVGCQKPEPAQSAIATVQPAVESQQPAAETEQPTFDPDLLTYEELLSMASNGHVESFRRIFKNLDAAYAHYETAFVAEYEVLSVENYIKWDGTGFFGYSVVEARVNKINDEYNSVNVKPGDIVRYHKNSYARTEDFDKTVEFFIRECGQPIKSVSELDPDKIYSVKLPLQRGEKYKYFIFDNEYPEKVGETYTMLCAMGEELDRDDDYPNNIALYVRPANSDIDLAKFAEEHDFIYDDDCIEIAEEIAALFK